MKNRRYPRNSRFWGMIVVGCGVLPLMVTGCGNAQEYADYYARKQANAAAPPPKESWCKVKDMSISGGSYKGGCKDGLADGQGEAYGIASFPDAYVEGAGVPASYVGAFSNGYPHGEGTYQWPSGAKYVGEFIMGNRKGFGTYYNTAFAPESGLWDGSRLVKACRSRRDCGLKESIADQNTGCKVWNPNPQPNETVTWTGACLDGFADGMGVLTWYNGTKQQVQRYEGAFVNKEMNGRGIYTWGNGDRYEGEFKDGQRTGKGMMLYAVPPSSQIKKYVGDFVNGKIHGRGIGDFFDGDHYEGEWRDFSPVGETVKNTSTQKERETIVYALIQAVAGDSTHWSFNSYDYGSLSFDKVKLRHPNNSIAVARADYTYNHGRKGWVEGRFYSDGSLECITFHDKADTCRLPRTSKAELAAGRSGDYELYADYPKFEKGEKKWSASCKDSGYAWVTQQAGSSVYSWCGGGFAAAKCGADYTLTVEQMLRNACKGG